MGLCNSIMHRDGRRQGGVADIEGQQMDKWPVTVEVLQR